MNKENTNVFEGIVETLIKDAKSLQKKFTALQEKNDFRGALDAMRLLKDTLSLIKEYDWELKYQERDLSDHDRQEIVVWEQNHCGEIRNRKSWNVVSRFTNDKDRNRWYRIFDDYIVSGKSYLADNAHLHRNTGKSYALAKLCNEYNGLIIYKARVRVSGIENADKELGIVNTFVPYERGKLGGGRYKDKILFIDECSGLLQEDLEELEKNHIVIGFR